MSRLWSRDFQLKNIQFSFKLLSVQSGFQIGGKQGFMGGCEDEVLRGAVQGVFLLYHYAPARSAQD